jgi:hypothetical protein
MGDICLWGLELDCLMVRLGFVVHEFVDLIKRSGQLSSKLYLLSSLPNEVKPSPKNLQKIQVPKNRFSPR